MLVYRYGDNMGQEGERSAAHRALWVAVIGGRGTGHGTVKGRPHFPGDRSPTEIGTVVTGYPHSRDNCLSISLEWRRSGDQDVSVLLPILPTLWPEESPGGQMFLLL